MSEVWVLTRQGNRSAIEGFLRANALPNVHFAYCDLPFWGQGSRKRSVNLHYYLWQFAAYLKARKLQRQVDFDVVHHVTYVRFWTPSFLSLLPVPFVWGPVGGGESVPACLWRSLSRRGRLYEICRDLARRLGHLDPFVRMTARRAALALATTRDTERELRRLGCRQTKVWSEAALAGEEAQRLGQTPLRAGGPFRVISLGRLLEWKGFALGLQAFEKFHRRHPESQYWIIGDGPQRNRLERAAREAGLRDAVKLWGRLERREVLAKLAQADVLLHPSLHDSGGWVCLEAMAAGRPVVCLDLGGPGVQVTDETGIKVGVVSAEQTIADLAGALERLAASRELRGELAARGRQRIEREFLWDKKAQLMMSLYHDAVCSSACSRPAVTTESVV